MNLIQNLQEWNKRCAEKSPGPGLFAAAAFVVLAVLAGAALERAPWSAEIVFWLKRRYFVWVREPVLSWYAIVFLQTFLLKLGLSLAIVFYLKLTGRNAAQALALSSPLRFPGRKILCAFAGFCLVSAWVSGFDPLSPAFPMHSLFEEALIVGNLIAVFSIVVVAPLAEEIIFRGFLYPAFARAFGAAPSVVIVGALFAAAHGPQSTGNPSALGWIFAGGIFLTAARAVTGSTRAAVALHAFYNACLLIFGALRYAVLGY